MAAFAWKPKGAVKGAWCLGGGKIPGLKGLKEHIEPPAITHNLQQDVESFSSAAGVFPGHRL